MFWDALKADDQELLAAAGVRRTYRAGTRLFLYGDEPTFSMIILSGVIKLTRASIDGREIIIELRGRGYLLGELGPIDAVPRNAAAVVVEDVEAIVLTATAFRNLLREQASICYAVLTIVSEKLRQATDRRLEAGVGDATSRLCSRLVELADATTVGPEGVIELQSPLTQQELADWIGVSRDAVVLAMRRIRDAGWVETGRRSIRILDLASLRAAGVE